MEIHGKYGTAWVFVQNTPEETVISQIFEILNKDFVKEEQIRIMPDCHAGVGCVIGYTQTYSGGALNPNLIGCDIGCGVRTVKIEVDSKNLERLDLLDHRIRNVIPIGENLNSKNIVDEKLFRKFMKSRLEKARASWPELLNFEGLNEIDKYIESTIKRLGMQPSIFWKSLGTLGGGNHFLEVGHMDSDPDNVVYVTVHTGSRNLGIKILSYWNKLTNKVRIFDKKGFSADQKEIRKTVPKAQIAEEIEKLINSGKYHLHPSGYLEHISEIQGYLKDMAFAQAYADYNREIILSSILANCFKVKRELETIESIHNYIDLEDRVIRKGAIAAHKGTKLIIPINMSYGSLICEGLENENWNYSAPHGAGRVLSRGKAKELLNVEEFRHSMEGVFSSCIDRDRLDESPAAYKQPEEIIDVIEGKTVRILGHLKSLLSIKG